MDDATRAELSALRRRAFGPAPDIAGDPAALDRLAVLEGLARAEHAAGPLRPEAQGDPPVASEGRVATSRDGDGAREDASADDGMPPTPEGTDLPARRSPRRRDGAALAVAAALVAVAVVVSSPQTPRTPASADPAAAPAPSAYAAALDDGAQQLFEIPVGGWYGIQMATPQPDEIPFFPASGPVLWATSLGEYYGWQLWIGGAAGALQLEHCLLLARGGVTHGRCVPATTRPDGELAVSLTYRHIAPEERPDGLAPGQRLSFWWARDDVVSILLATSAL